MFSINFHKDKFEKSLDESLSKLGVDYVDLLLLQYVYLFRMCL